MQIDNDIEMPEAVAWIWKYANGEEEVVFVDLARFQLDPTEWDVPTEVTPLYTADQLRAAVRAAVLREREACAKVCDGLTHALDNSGVSYHRPAGADRCARAIRSMGSKGNG